MIFRNRDGSATVENIIWLPLLLLIFSGIIQFGLIFNARNAVQAASFEAARQAALSDEPASVAKFTAYNFALGVLPGWREGGRVRICVSTPQGIEPGSPLKVEVIYDVPIFFSGFLPGLETSPGIVAVRGSSAVRIEEKP